MPYFYDYRQGHKNMNVILDDTFNQKSHSEIELKSNPSLTHDNLRLLAQSLKKIDFDKFPK